MAGRPDAGVLLPDRRAHHLPVRNADYDAQ